MWGGQGEGQRRGEEGEIFVAIIVRKRKQGQVYKYRSWRRVERSRRWGIVDGSRCWGRVEGSRSWVIVEGSRSWGRTRSQENEDP